MIVCLDNPETRKLFGLRHGFKVCTGARYLGGFIGDDDSKRVWLLDCTLEWGNNVHTISKTAEKYPQGSYAVVVIDVNYPFSVTTKYW